MFDRRQAGVFLTLALLCAAHLVPCYVTYRTAVLESELIPSGSDSYYHIRRIWLSARDYPFLLEFDSYANHPSGAYVQWPPGFDFLLAGVSRLAGGPDMPLYEAGRLSIMFSPLLGLPCVLIAWAMGRRLGGPAGGLIAGVLAALNPVLLYVAKAGHVDHHMLEPFFLAAALYFYYRAVEDGSGRAAWTSGFFMAAGFLFIPVAGMFPFLLFILMAAGAMSEGRAGDRLRWIRPGVSAFLSASVFAWAFVPLSYHARAGLFDPQTFSLLQPLMATSLLVASLIPYGLARARAGGGGVSRGVYAAAAALMLALGAAMALFPPIREGLAHVVKSNPVVASIEESKSILSLGVARYVSVASYGPFLWPLLIVWTLWFWRKGGGRQGVFLAYWLGVTALLGLTQFRFMVLSVPASAVVTSHMLVTLSRKRPEGIGRAAVPALAAAVVLIAALGVSGFIRSEGLFAIGRVRQLGAYYDALTWLRDKTPRTSHYDNPRESAEYGVLSGWDVGHEIVFYGERPNIVNPLNHVNLEDAARFFASLSEDDALGICRRLGVRYVLVRNESVLMYLDYLRRDHAGFVSEKDGKPAPMRDYYRAMATRLYQLGGRGLEAEGEGCWIDALGGFRLVYDSRYEGQGGGHQGGGQGSSKLPGSRVFEVVPGVRVRGKAAPGLTVSARTSVVTNRGSEFSYEARAVADASGVFELRLPYSTLGNPYETGAAGPYIISDGDRDVELAVAEGAVMSGQGVEIDFRQETASKRMSAGSGGE